MAWQDYSILGGDLTKDMAYEIIKLVGGTTLASDMIERNNMTFTNLADKDSFLGSLPEIYNLCKSNNKIEETWNMQVLSYMINSNYTLCYPYIHRESARVIWNHIEYELNNLSGFGWSASAQPLRREFVKSLHQSFGRINFQGIHHPFGVVTPDTSATSTSATSVPAVIAPFVEAAVNVIAPVPVVLPNPPTPPSSPSTNELINVIRGDRTGEHRVLSVVRDWQLYVTATKQWSYRILETNRGYIVQTRWGKRNRNVNYLRVTSKVFFYRQAAMTFARRTVVNKLNGGYNSAY